MRDLPRELTAEQLAELFEGRTAFVERLAAEPDPLVRARTLVHELPDDEKPVGAYYTVRRWDPERQRLHLQFVLHDDPGPAATWAARAEVGDPVALWGPRTAFDPPPGTDRYVLCADETGLPAVAAILEWLPQNIESEDGRNFLGSIAELQGNAKADALEAAAKKVGLSDCQLAASWRQPPQ